MNEVRDARALALIEQAIGGELPAGWRELEPPRNREREAAAVLLRLAERSDVTAMTAAAEEGMRRAAERRHDAEAGEQRFWERLQALLATLGEPAADRPPSLAGLGLWAGGPVPALLDGVDRDLRGTVAAGGPVAPATLAALAQIVLRARARSWLVTTRSRERQPVPGSPW